MLTNPMDGLRASGHLLVDSPFLQPNPRASPVRPGTGCGRGQLALCGFALGILLTGCSQDVPAALSTATLLVWMTPTPSATSTAAPASPATSTPPLPSPTPFTYTVRESDTLIGIAVRFGVSLEDLRAANPQVNERFLSIGQTLTVPLALAATPQAAAATPYPLQLDPPRCYPQLGGAAWCISQVHNPGGAPVESILVEFSIYDAQGKPLTGQPVTPPLARLAPGGTLPVGLLVSGPSAGMPRAEARLVRAVAVAQPADSLPSIEVVEAAATPLQGGLEVRVRARVAPQAAGPATAVRVLLVLYNSQGQVVGWRTQDLSGEWAIGQAHDLQVRAFSLGDPVARYEVLLEAHP